jgi:pyridoxine 4-dehydrogenase
MDDAGAKLVGGDLTVRRIGLGTLRIMNAGPDRAREVLKRAVELGVNLIDTADAYADGQIELLIAEALHPYPDGLVIATKGGQKVVDGEPRADGRPEHLRAACEASLRRLRLDRIELYQLHNPDPAVPLEESLGALGELRAEGKIRHLGVSNVWGPSFEAAVEAGAVALQNAYSVTVQRSRAELARCEQEGLAFLPYFPLAAGELADANGAVGEIARARGASPAQVALAWLLQLSPVTVPIPCTTSLEHLEENLRSSELTLTPDELASLEAPAAA